MVQRTTAAAGIRARRSNGNLISIDPIGIAYLGTVGIVMLGWIASLVWGAMAFFNWLVA